MMGEYEPKDNVKCDECHAQAVWQDLYDGEACEFHLREAMAADVADIAVKAMKEDF